MPHLFIIPFPLSRVPGTSATTEASFLEHLKASFFMEKMGERKMTKQQSAGPRFSGYNPFDSDSDSESEVPLSSATTTRQLSTPSTSKERPSTKLFLSRKDEETVTSSSVSSSEKTPYTKCRSDLGGIENKNSQELENYAVFKAEEATEKFKSCLKIAEDIRGDAANTLVTLHHQGEQITQTHMEVTKIDHDLTLGEKLLGSLGGIFSKSWGPKKTRTITGPLIMRNDSSKSSSNSEDRGRLGLTPTSRQTSLQNYSSNPSTPIEKVEVEKAKQDDALSDLSNLLSELKDMAVDMGSEIGRHGKALDHFDADVDELNFRLKGANQRGRRLLGK
ncbi:hypothetical protein H6P81_019489 [Aristolochia fimbriata]|uniref:t-SNARE coiled-coil homology domain-containing protein n=1 Tax=Aristolochia fimbriata TaxID=158543 RepID=A0AAV7DS37_ARIFI|nr:hypothetical protein H6P81_019489 [Aristolochia fimbriata]